ncbi:long-chain fatty acid--CoA ligase [Neobacillus sp. 114]|uniref:long-chain fatty acid--CoA ligase n=1 Tax=Neobacillus sp. 114 TaxID=3048535 RepID=UPI0024C2C45D|nr:long-chain fatty acid--CoA ligase [Neobacillus sp. 114]
MMTRHYEFWPKRLGTSLPVPKSTVHHNLEVTTARYPDKTAIIYYGTEISYKQLSNEVNRLAGFLQKNLGVSKGDRVALYMQNSPQYIISFYAILRVDAVVVPVNPMNVKDEVAFYLTDCGAKIAIAGQELIEHIQPSLGKTPLEQIIVATYADYAQQGLDYSIPDVVVKKRVVFDSPHMIEWEEALALGSIPNPSEAKSEDLCCLPYTSGTTGKPKGCMHTHKTMQSNIFGASLWSQHSPSAVSLAILPFFHVTGLQHLMNTPIYTGGTIIVMTRWDRDTAGKLIERYSCTHWICIATMLVDFLANPNLSGYNLKSLKSISGGGAALPKAVGEKLYQLTGIEYGEGYGLSETIAQTHMNPRDRPKMQCMGVPQFDVDARIIDPNTMIELGPNEEGEVILNGPQVFKGYWNRSEDTANAFIQLDGKTFFRTGDIAFYDEEGYFFMVDRVKRMINASGFKVWPAEVESLLYKHPAVKHACVIGVPDPRRGETVKAFIVLNEKLKENTTEEEIITWSKKQMAAYKYPRVVQFLDKLPTSGSGKILWRKLQEVQEQKQR